MKVSQKNVGLYCVLGLHNGVPSAFPMLHVSRGPIALCIIHAIKPMVHQVHVKYDTGIDWGGFIVQ